MNLEELAREYRQNRTCTSSEWMAIKDFLDYLKIKEETRNHYFVG